jgi:antitoxin component YwqK of YwqJK toxin-antitoxin module
MKATLFALFVGLLMVGCGRSSTPSTPSDPVNPAKAIDLDDKVTRDKILAEAINDKKLQRRGKEGEALYYVRNQQTPYTGWAKGMRKNGQIRRLDQYKDGKKDGLVQVWYENRQKRSEAKWKDGKLVTIVAWKPNGEKCPVTKVVNGNGVRTWYNDDGTEDFRVTIKDGEIVR